jgi:hypothetical protein
MAVVVGQFNRKDLQPTAVKTKANGAKALL